MHVHGKNINHHKPFVFVGRDGEIAQIKRVVHKAERNSVLIVGQPGVGKTSLAEAVIGKLSDFEVLRLYASDKDLEDKINQGESKRAKPLLLVMDEVFSFGPKQVAVAMSKGVVLAVAGETA